MRVYIWPKCIGTDTLYGDPSRVRTTTQWDGAPGQKVEHVQRSQVLISGEVVRTNAPDFDIMMDRLRGGVHLVGLWDHELRIMNGWDGLPALNSLGAEFWRKDGRTEDYAGESDNAPTGPWRTVLTTCNGGAAIDAVSLPVTGLLASEAIPRGMMIRIGDYRHRTLAAVTADASGDATLSLATPLRAVVADGDQIRIPGDFFVGSLNGDPKISPANADGLRTFTIAFREVYEDELSDTSVSPTETFEYVVD